MKALLGKKLGMTQVLQEDGKAVPVTLIEAGPCKVLGVLTKEKNGYQAVQLGFEALPARKITKSRKGKEFRYIREFPLTNTAKPGDTLDVSLFQEGDKVIVSAISKGKGFQGGVKRWGFHGRNSTRGTKHEERTIGSVGAAMPSEVWAGKKMPGHMGSDRVSTKNIKVVKVDKENHVIAINGSVPGPNGGVVEIKVM